MTYESLRGDISGRKTASLLVGINDQPRRPILQPKLANIASSPGAESGEPHDVVETLSCAQASRAGTDDENVDLTVQYPSATSIPSRTPTSQAPPPLVGTYMSAILGEK